MKPLIFDYTSTFGGAFEQALGLAVELSRFENYQVGFVSAQAAPELESRVPTHIESFTVPPYTSFGKSDQSGFSKLMSNALDLAAECARALRLRKFIKAHGSQVLMMNNLVNMQQSGVIAAKVSGIKSVSCHQDFEYDSRSARYFASIVDYHVAISEPIKDNLISIGVPESKIRIIHNGIDTERFSPEVEPLDLQKHFGIAPDTLVFSLFGRLVPWKGHEIFIRAAREILEQVPESVGLIVGSTSDGEESYEDELRSLANELGIADKIIFAGYQRKVPNILAASDVVLHLSIRPEPFGLVVSEAMACGRPIVAMAEGGPLEIVQDGQDGFLVEPRNPTAVANAVVPLLQQSELRARIGDAAVKRARALFSSRMCAEKYAGLFEEIVRS